MIQREQNVFESVLIANRGEIACRIIKTAKRLGIRTIAVYSEADAEALHVKQADEAYLIGPAAARESYLVAEKILAVAEASKAASVHPGYGFLSENAEFAEACEAAGVVFIGPPASAIRAMGLKDAAKTLVEKANVPVVPGYHGDNQNDVFLHSKAQEVGYPVLIKAVAGGGGKGMRRVDHDEDFQEALASARREARSAFGNDAVLIERYVLKPRHIEMQVFGDTHGNVVHLFERDCSLQRRHQKVIEEAPAPGMTEAVRTAMGKAAVEAAKAVKYVGAGTIEFIADGSDGLRPDGFFFMEMNTRLQVEHPVTEAITGLDLVELQFRIAFGEPLPFRQEDLRIRGHAVEARLYAEDPENGFLPSTGKLHALDLKADEGIRIDTGVSEGDTVSPFYDPMIAKVIAHAATRNEALDRLSDTLKRSEVVGPRTNTAFLRALCDSAGFRDNQFDTGFIDRNLAELGAVPQPVDGVAVTEALAALIFGGFNDTVDSRIADPWAVRDQFSIAPRRPIRKAIDIDGRRYEAEFSFGKPPRISIAAAGLDAPFPSITGGMDSNTRLIDTDHEGMFVLRHGRQIRVAFADLLDVDLDAGDGRNSGVKAPMHGKLIAVLIKTGDHVVKGQKLAIVEAMKMEHALTAPRDGTVGEILADEGTQVAEGARILLMTAEEV